jgi:hypothetical protein
MMNFDNKYHLVNYRIPLTKDTSLSDILHINTESAESTSMGVYTVINNNTFFYFKYRESSIDPASQIYLTLAGDSLQNVVKNDSIISYHILCDNFSIKYSKSEAVDIFVVGKDKAFGTTIVIPMDLLFLKRDSAVYLIMMIPNDPRLTIQPDLLYNIVTGK